MAICRLRVSASLIAALTLAVVSCAPDAIVVPNGLGAPPVATSTGGPQPSEPTSEPTATQHEPEVSETAEPTPSASADTVLLKEGDQGDEVREIQHRLLQLDWYEGKITPNYSPETVTAVEGFQAKRGLPVTGEVDSQTLRRLEDMTREPTHDELFNILRPGPALMKQGDTSAKVRELQSRLRQIGWYGEKVDDVYGAETVEGVRGFQEKRGFPVTGEVDQRTLDKLMAMTRNPTEDELNNILPEPGEHQSIRLDVRCLTGRVICISKKDRQLAWVVDGKVQLQMDVRFGASKSPTREGTFRVEWKSRNHVSKLYDSEMPYALFFSGGQAVHYSSDFARRGYRGASHGCVNVRDKDAVANLFDLAKVGDKVIVYAD